jgi:alpha-beta hydrolase superfamily lysophospholipase
MSSTTSADGTTISYDRTGDGPPVILVVGAFNERPTGAALAAALSDSFTVVNYDRRGRGTSTDTLPYAVEREIEDLDALISEVGGSAAVFGYSSGAVLSMCAAADGLHISKLALYDAPFAIPGTDPDWWADLARRLDELVRADRRGDAVELFQSAAVGIPPEVIAQIRKAPFWAALEAIAHTLVYESLILASPAELAKTVSTPTLVLDGELSPEPIRVAAEALAGQLPNTEWQTVPGANHDLDPTVLVPLLGAFYRD